MTRFSTVKVKDGLLVIGGAANSTVKFVDSDFVFRAVNLQTVSTVAEFPSLGGLSCVADEQGTKVYCTGGASLRNGAFERGYSILQQKGDSLSWDHSFVPVSPNFASLYERINHVSFTQTNSIVLFGGDLFDARSPVAVKMSTDTASPTFNFISVDDIFSFQAVCAFTLPSGGYILGKNDSGNIQVAKYSAEERSFAIIPSSNQGPTFQQGMTCTSNSTTILLTSGCERPESPWYLRIQENNVSWQPSQATSITSCNGTITLFPNDHLVYVGSSANSNDASLSITLFDSNTGKVISTPPSLASPKISSIFPVAELTPTASVITENSVNNSLNLSNDKSPIDEIGIGGIVGISIAGFVVLCAIILGLICWRRRSSKNYKKYSENLEDQPTGYAQVDMEQDGFIKLDDNDIPTPVARTSSLASAVEISTINPETELLIPSAGPPTLETAMLGLSRFKADGVTKYLVKYDHYPELSDELKISAGDYVIISKIYGDGWAKGMCGDQQGAFPLTHLA